MKVSVPMGGYFFDRKAVRAGEGVCAAVMHEHIAVLALLRLSNLSMKVSVPMGGYFFDRKAVRAGEGVCAAVMHLISDM